MPESGILWIIFLVSLASSLENNRFPTNISCSQCPHTLYNDSSMHSFLRDENLWNDETTTILKTKKETLSVLLRQKENMSLILSETRNKTEYLGNLLNAFALVRRVVKWWPSTLAKLSDISDLPVKKLPIKTADLYTSGMTGLVRIQQVYNISSERMASASMYGSALHSKFTAGDCLDIAVFYYNLKHQERAVEWLLAGLRRVHRDHVTKQKILEYLHLAQCFNGDDETSASTYAQIRREFPFFKPSPDLRDDYFSASNQSCKEIAKLHKDIVDNEKKAPFYVKNLGDICQKNTLYNFPNDHRLKCHMVHYNLPHLKIWPFKFEELHLDPPILKVHEVFYDSEIQYLKTAYLSRMKRATDEYGVPDDYFLDPLLDTQHKMWLKEDDPTAPEYNDPVARRITQRTAAITNLDFYLSEPTMMGSYGLAAEVKLHSDCRSEKFLLSEEVAEPDYFTLIYYLNNVPEGGFTAFPKMKLAVIPEKGTAVMWFNRYSDWSTINEMDHVSCPVIQGSKLTITRWFHVRRQDFPKCVSGKEKTHKYYYL